MPSMEASLLSVGLLDSPSSLHSLSASQNSLLRCSPSPRKKTSAKSAMGSGLQQQGPPKATMGSLSPLSAASSGMPPRSSISRAPGYDISYCSVKPTASNSHRGSLLSRVKSF